MSKRLRDYVSETSIHGLKYLAGGGGNGDDHASSSPTLPSRLLWASLVGTSFLLSGIMVASSLDDAARHPVTSSFDLVDVRALPFPAVTVNAGDLPFWTRSKGEGRHATIFFFFAMFSILTRFPEEVLNGIEYSCVDGGGDRGEEASEGCLRSREEVLLRYGDFVSTFVRKVFFAVEDSVRQLPEVAFCFACICDSYEVNRGKVHETVLMTIEELTSRCELGPEIPFHKNCSFFFFLYCCSPET